MPKITGLLETALYVDDMARSVAFFETVLGLRAMLRTERLTAFDAGRSGVLLVFARGASRADMPSEAGLIPGHDGNGRCIWLSPSRPTHTMNGHGIYRVTRSRSTAKYGGRGAAAAYTFTIPMATCSN